MITMNGKRNDVTLILIATTMCLMVWVIYDTVLKKKEPILDPRIEVLLTPINPELEIISGR